MEGTDLDISCKEGPRSRGITPFLIFGSTPRRVTLTLFSQSKTLPLYESRPPTLTPKLSFPSVNFQD